MHHHHLSRETFTAVYRPPPKLSTRIGPALPSSCGFPRPSPGPFRPNGRQSFSQCALVCNSSGYVSYACTRTNSLRYTIHKLVLTSYNYDASNTDREMFANTNANIVRIKITNTVVNSLLMAITPQIT
jgi:hypothetical protein